MGCPKCLRSKVAAPTRPARSSQGCAGSGEHAGNIDDYYCTDGGIVTLCQSHLKDAVVVVWDDSVTPPVPITKKYYDEVYSKK